MKNYKDIIQQFKPEMEKTVEFLKTELKKIRTGKASPALVEDILVDYYGVKTPIKQLGAISCPEPRQIIIQPWDKNSLESVGKALSQADIGAAPVVDKDVVRINIPSLTEEYRKNLVSQINRKKEESRESIRKWRDHIVKEIQKEFQDKEISEDEKFKAKDEVQELVDEYTKEIDEIVERKDKEIIEI